jgi:Cu+-exporting ATPase
MPEKSIALPITGMTCANCAANIERSLKKLQGIEDVAVNFASEKANVRYDPNQATVNDLVDSVQRAGYGVVSTHLELPITGMTCANCAANIERVLDKKLNGVLQASVNFASERAAIDYLPEIVRVDDIFAAIEKAGYGAIISEESQEDEDGGTHGSGLGRGLGEGHGHQTQRGGHQATGQDEHDHRPGATPVSP